MKTVTMFKKVSLRKLQIILLVASLVFVGGVFNHYVSLSLNAQESGSISPETTGVYGWAWNDIGGWTKLNCKDHPAQIGGCDPLYGVFSHLELTSRNFSDPSWAWSDILGWIDFSGVTVVPDRHGPGEGIPTTYHLEGYARVIASESVGGVPLDWISLHCSNHSTDIDTSCTGTNDYKYGVTATQNSNCNFQIGGVSVNVGDCWELSGYAWGENTGWWCFGEQCNNSNVTGTYAYIGDSADPSLYLSEKNPLRGADVSISWNCQVGKNFVSLKSSKDEEDEEDVLSLSELTQITGDGLTQGSKTITAPTAAEVIYTLRCEDNDTSISEVIAIMNPLLISLNLTANPQIVSLGVGGTETITVTISYQELSTNLQEINQCKLENADTEKILHTYERAGGAINAIPLGSDQITADFPIKGTTNYLLRCTYDVKEEKCTTTVAQDGTPTETCTGVYEVVETKNYPLRRARVDVLPRGFEGS